MGFITILLNTSYSINIRKWKPKIRFKRNLFSKTVQSIVTLMIFLLLSNLSNYVKDDAGSQKQTNDTERTLFIWYQSVKKIYGVYFSHNLISHLWGCFVLSKINHGKKPNRTETRVGKNIFLPVKYTIFPQLFTR